MSSSSFPKPLTPRPKTKSNVPAAGRQNAKKAPIAKTPGKPNTSILSFFKKVDSPLKDDSIFLSQGSQVHDTPSRPKPIVGIDEDLEGIYCDEDIGRFNEAAGSIKRRKTSSHSIPEGSVVVAGEGRSPVATIDGHGGAEIATSNGADTPPLVQAVTTKPKRPRRKGPFLSDSESDDENSNKVGNISGIEAGSKSTLPSSLPAESANQYPWKRRKKVPVAAAQAKWEALQPNSTSSSSDSDEAAYSRDQKNIKQSRQPPTNALALAAIPSLNKEATSGDDWNEFNDMEELPDDVDEFIHGEESIERRWMEEEARRAAAEDEEEFNGFDDEITSQKASEEEIIAACPICNATLEGINSEDVTRHVNACLDGNLLPLPVSIGKIPSEVKIMPEGAHNRFARKAAIARPGQANPFEIGSASAAPSSAFSKLMAGHAEDEAWTIAATAEQTSRGKPAYKRTCPFYKIMPGLFICVDAFRYGAVQGCKAYFLSHFHSDHYVGLTSSWCHGPIYCSKVTANLVKQQLRVDPKWVVALEFEERFEVPETQGVAVTMIPANHCPGSSLFLYEKVLGKGNNPKVQRILHCGDFRACAAHVGHPLLMPNVVDSISGKLKQQKIDVCYLDTTYLNPRYSFPSQDEVVTACTDMCVSLTKDCAEESDVWETAKRERAGPSMAKFVNSVPDIKAEDDSMVMDSRTSKSGKSRGRLLIVCGTYSIGKEKICMGIARALDCKIWAPPGKLRICAALEDPELMGRMTDDPKEAQIHMQMLMELRPETLQDYLNLHKPHFGRIVGFRPSGWNYRPPKSRLTDSPTVPAIINSPNWRSAYTLQDLVPQRGSTREASCFSVPYSEHSSFRELTLFVCALRIEKVVPTVNVGSAPTRAKMKMWIDRWLAERRKNGCLKVGDGQGEVRW
ncbi:DRMBL-domain-containing protein [Venustampulla echinocandica]|uniref:DRMBL-domain-containing protein n=1 Tax=Venustampulla echinocandica TaxID=2656787 RepID=A0A370TSN0_9HELO|nr:DRMBL-domain-containing protein [Venustampulla echinocandica]RDL38539.1 DRMBL-domain-containing protein [Venustampulla echinocandica]